MRADTMADRMSLPLTGRLLVLDALAHGEASPPWEQAVLNIAGYTAEMLEAHGASVLVTSGTPAQASVAARARQIEQHGAEVVLFLRTGSHPSTQIRGVRALVPSPYALSSRRLAERLLKRVSARTGLPSRGVPLWSWFPPDLSAMIRGHRPVSLMLECATPTCPADELLLMRRSFQLRVAHGLMEGLLDYFGLRPDEENAPDAAAGVGFLVTGAGVDGTDDGTEAERAGESDDVTAPEPAGGPDIVAAPDPGGGSEGAAAPTLIGGPDDGAAANLAGEPDGAAAPDLAEEPADGAAAPDVAFTGLPTMVVTARPPGKPDREPRAEVPSAADAPGQELFPAEPPGGGPDEANLPATGDQVLEGAAFQPPAAEGLRSGRAGPGRPPAAGPQRPGEPAAHAGGPPAPASGGQPEPSPAPGQGQRARPAWAKKILAVWPADPNQPVQRTVTPAWQQPSSPIPVPQYQGPVPPIGFVQTGQRPPWTGASQPPPGPQHAPHAPWPAQDPTRPPINTPAPPAGAQPGPRPSTSAAHAPAAGQEPGPAAQVPFLGNPGGPEPMIVWPDGSLVSPRAQILMRLQTRSAADKEKKATESPTE
ncbi:N-acetylmuramoyl-L-alanine amidase family protein [Symbiobacterium thermophilum]|uniref:MurNAc-LAA domain-containing protein n=1 Tax=Symbiobacterium thermophilum (strain DSM 24528 / JCM 14929 / IAM 14863 / T) TaxID=292459 RepID=Q67PM9_SYMTH|nr:N-acetylmuramoyl-L-alanine amidase [Symbiobacterium thermophilum]BAD40364.1 hypothetical protein, proline-rich [Symbiobacterium thermophilum IAM 14863]